MEYKAGVPPTYDLLTLGGHVAEGMRAGVFERMDWKPLLTEDMNPDVLHESPLMRGGIIYHTGHFGLMYNSEKVKPGEVPKTMGDLVNPKWRGKGGIEGTTNSMLRWAFILGKEKVFSHIRAILKNEAIQGRYVDLLNRFLLGEIAWCTINSAMLKDAQDKGMPAAWQSLDFSDIQDYSLVLVKGSRQPNAAKLISLYLASPAGARFLMEEAKGGTLYYPGNYEHEIRLQDQKQGIREIFTTKKEEILEFYDSKEAAQWEKDLVLLLQTGGR
jgi:ABC-type Fe3+ transport system substrate-binding protein